MINANSYSSMVQRIDHIRVSESDRRIGTEPMHKAEFVADLICRAGAQLWSAAAFMSAALAHRARIAIG